MAPDASVRVGTRGSRLALWQADHVVARLASLRPGEQFERVVVRTTGDRVLDTALSKIGDKGLFTKELEQALREERVDLVVHSLKDLPTALAPDLVLAAVLAREDPRDALVSAERGRLTALPAGARVGTSSLRRRAQLLARRADLRIVDLRGNVNTRVERVRRGEYDAAVLARAGLVRLGLEAEIAETFEPEVLLPAVGQGALAVQVRAGDQRTRGLLAPLDDASTRLATAAERALLGRLEGGCQVPVGALAALEQGRLTLRGLVADPFGGASVGARVDGLVASEAEAAALGVRLAERLLRDGAAPILERVRGAAVAAVVGEDGP